MTDTEYVDTYRCQYPRLVCQFYNNLIFVPSLLIVKIIRSTRYLPVIFSIKSELDHFASITVQPKRKPSKGLSIDIEVVNFWWTRTRSWPRKTSEFPTNTFNFIGWWYQPVQRRYQFKESYFCMIFSKCTKLLTLHSFLNHGGNCEKNYSKLIIMISGMTVNWLTDTLYWADNTLEHIMCSELDGRYHKILIPNAGSVKGLAADAVHKWVTPLGNIRHFLSFDWAAHPRHKSTQINTLKLPWYFTWNASTGF